ncbi:MAG: hypothetical protein J0L58_19915 [Burkholderiales bacterium]|uniref:hypothetical protein n=1 Tax=Inhella sp. TaxID=1921806 RepID=UPI001AC32AD9|nr:hypothetical protein [Burkholderiales bacterium]
MSKPPQPRRLRSDDYASGPFAPHGRVEIWSEGSVVRLRAEGPFNAESVQAIGLAMAQLFAEAPPKGRFADILVFHGSILATPEALAAFDGFLARMSQAKTAPLAVAYVVGAEVEGRDLMLPVFKRLYDKHRRRFAHFEDEAQAEAWVREQLSADGG